MLSGHLSGLCPTSADLLCQTATLAARYIESGRLSEHQAFDASEADMRKQQAAALAAAALVAVLVLVLVGVAHPAAVDAVDKPLEGLGLTAAPSPPRRRSRPTRS